jgi:subtilisin family serine protease
VKNIWTTAAPRYPANYDLPNVISVAATVDDKLAWYSNPAAAVGAPGSLRSTLPGNRYGVKSGTSMAAPYALNLLIHALANNSSLTNEDLKSLLPDLPGITPKEDMKRPNLLDSALQINKQNLVEYPGFYALTVILYALTAIQYAAEKHARKGREDIEKMKMV